MVTMKPFKFWVQSVLPLVYDDSLSYYELLCKVVNYINLLITNTNDLGEGLNSLREYVDEYFDNLDVQEEVNEKLDEMAESGELQNLIGQYLEIGVKHYETAEDLIESDDVSVGNVCYTQGYYSVNDGGAAHYVITNGEDYTFELENGLKAKIITNGNVNIVSYGASPSLADCTSIISKCVNENKNIYIPSGTYLISSAIQCAGKHIYGEGKIKVIANSEITFALCLEGNGDVDIEGIEIDCSSSACYGIGAIVFNYSDNIVIKNVEVHHTNNYWTSVEAPIGCAGIFINGSIKSVLVEGCYIHDITRTLTMDYAIASVGIAVNINGIIRIVDNTIEGITCSSNVSLDSDGIHVYNASADFTYHGTSYIEGNNIKNCTTRGIKIQKPNCVVQNNNISVDTTFFLASNVLGIDNQVGGCSIRDNIIKLEGADARCIAVAIGNGVTNVIEGNKCEFITTPGIGVEINAPVTQYNGGDCIINVLKNIFKTVRRGFAFRFATECSKVYIKIDSNEINIGTGGIGIWSQTSTVEANLSSILYLVLTNNINNGARIFSLYPALNFSNYVSKENFNFSTVHGGQWDWNDCYMFEAVAPVPANAPTGYTRNNFVRVLNTGWLAEGAKVYERYNTTDGYYVGS